MVSSINYEIYIVKYFYFFPIIVNVQCGEKKIKNLKMTKFCSRFKSDFQFRIQQFT